MSLSPDKLGNLFAKIGQFLLVDDAHDIGNFDRLHHWQYGFIMSLAGEMMKLGNNFASFTNNLLTRKPSPSPPTAPQHNGHGESTKQLEKLVKKDYLKGRLP